jgi:hypothetical protein
MSKTVVISDELATRLEARRKREGDGSLDAVAEALISVGLAFDEPDSNYSVDYTTDELQALISEAEASGPAELWSPKADFAEIRHRQAARSQRGG